MTDVDPHATRRDLVPNIPAELLEAGFDNVEEIGRGGFGVVYRCVQPSLDRAVAVKVLSTDLDRDNLERFLREQRAMGRLSGHPHIVTVLQVGVLAGGRPFIVMPYHAKNSLETLIRRHGPLDWRETLSIGVKLAGALEAAHRVGTLHRDVKPGNILLTRLRGTAADRFRNRQNRRGFRDGDRGDCRFPGFHRAGSSRRSIADARL